MATLEGVNRVLTTKVVINFSNDGNFLQISRRYNY